MNITYTHHLLFKKEKQNIINCKQITRLTLSGVILNTNNKREKNTHSEQFQNRRDKIITPTLTAFSHDPV